jgi:hypothetical protein
LAKIAENCDHNIDPWKVDRSAFWFDTFIARGFGRWLFGQAPNGYGQYLHVRELEKYILQPFNKSF